jgi:hypothetical protein
MWLSSQDLRVHIRRLDRGRKHDVPHVRSQRTTSECASTCSPRCAARARCNAAVRSSTSIVTLISHSLNRR